MLPLQSVLVVLVPAAEQLVGSYRKKYDPSAAAGMPAHITLLYPFKPPDEVNEAVLHDLAECFAHFEGFDFSLAAIRRFDPEVLYLAPEPDEPFRQLTLAMRDRFPETPPYGGKYSSIVPHLTVAQVAEEQQFGQIAIEFARIARGRLPIRASATEVVLMDTRAGSWQIRASFKIGRDQNTQH
jgi:2'-5' RNA ligase